MAEWSLHWTNRLIVQCIFTMKSFLYVNGCCLEWETDILVSPLHGQREELVCPWYQLNGRKEYNLKLIPKINCAWKHFIYSTRIYDIEYTQIWINNYQNLQKNYSIFEKSKQYVKRRILKRFCICSRKDTGSSCDIFYTPYIFYIPYMAFARSPGRRKLSFISQKQINSWTNLTNSLTSFMDCYMFLRTLVNSCCKKQKC